MDLRVSLIRRSRKLDVPAAGPKFVTPAEEAEALGFFVVASTLGLVSADCQLAA
jgi:hypothetical protein